MTTKSHLLACPACSRHVRATEAECPFCAALLPAAFATALPPRPPTKRLSRAALYAFGATSLTLATACSSGTDTTGDADGSADTATSGDASGGFDGSAAPLYGASALDGGFDGSAAPLYGASPGDSGIVPIDGAQEEDASEDEVGKVTPAYGAPGHPELDGGPPQG